MRSGLQDHRRVAVLSERHRLPRQHQETPTRLTSFDIDENNIFYVRFGIFVVFVDRRGFRNRDVITFFQDTAVMLLETPDADLEPLADLTCQ